MKITRIKIQYSFKGGSIDYPDFTSVLLGTTAIKDRISIKKSDEKDIMAIITVDGKTINLPFSSDKDSKLIYLDFLGKLICIILDAPESSKDKGVKELFDTLSDENKNKIRYILSTIMVELNNEKVTYNIFLHLLDIFSENQKKIFINFIKIKYNYCQIKFVVEGQVRVYEGFCKDGKANGKGRIVFDNKSLQYEGDFMNGTYHGKGVEYYFSSNIDVQIKRYEGDFVNGKRHGKGIEYFEDGSTRYEGDFVYGTYNGEGVLYTFPPIFSDVNIKLYKGDFKDGKANGRGILYFDNGSTRYEGDFINDRFHGMGKLNISDNIFFGKFENGNLHGRVQILKNGKIAFEGYYINGELDITQTCTIFYKDYFYLGCVNKKLEHHGHGEIYMNAIITEQKTITKPAELYFNGNFVDGKIQSGTIYRNGVNIPFNAETSVDENGIPLIVN